ncbi:hypothetical protein YC2023_044108 [Brassica napus]
MDWAGTWQPSVESNVQLSPARSATWFPMSCRVVIEGSWDCTNHHSPWPLLFDYISDLNATATHHNGYATSSCCIELGQQKLIGQQGEAAIKIQIKRVQERRCASK